MVVNPAFQAVQGLHLSKDCVNCRRTGGKPAGGGKCDLLQAPPHCQVESNLLIKG